MDNKLNPIYKHIETKSSVRVIDVLDRILDKIDGMAMDIFKNDGDDVFIPYGMVILREIRQFVKEEKEYRTFKIQQYKTTPELEEEIKQYLNNFNGEEEKDTKEPIES